MLPAAGPNSADRWHYTVTSRKVPPGFLRHHVVIAVFVPSPTFRGAAFHSAVRREAKTLVYELNLSLFLDRFLGKN